jgi:CRP-like cAMP-binding protein
VEVMASVRDPIGAGLEAHFRKLRARDEVSAAEEKAIRTVFVETREVPAHAVVVRRGQELSQSILLLDGWLARAQNTRKGARQILEVHLPGDFVDLHGFTLKRLDHDLIALTPATIAIAPYDRIRQLIDNYPHLARLYWLTTNIDAAIQRQWTFAMSRLPALARMARFFCELFLRLQVIDRATNNGFNFCLTQPQLGECLGLSAVHVNRTLQSLRSRGLVQLDNRYLTIVDGVQLRDLGEFSPDYLYLDWKAR